MNPYVFQHKKINFSGGLILFLFISQLTLSVNAQFSESDTIYPIETITPFEITGNESINFPFFQATPVGDINGDGLGDLVYNSGAADEQTEDPTDRIRKSAIITNINNPESALVFYHSEIYGIGDFNGDGYDDILDIYQKIIRFGSVEGISDDSLVISYPDDINKLYYAGDINNDGKSEFFIGEDYTDSLFVFSGPDTNSIILQSYNYMGFDFDRTMFYYYDYDNDGEKEFCITKYNWASYNRLVYWYKLDTVNDEFFLEENETLNVINEPSNHLPASFADINGDSKVDITHVYYENSGFHLEVCLGQDEDPYFDNPVEIEVGNPNRFLYCGGDLNNDAADDWYSKTHEDTVVVYFGHENVLTEGFDKEYYYTGNNQFLLPKSLYLSIFYSITRVPVFYYNDDSIPDLFFNYWSYDNNLQHDTVGTAIFCGGSNLDFTNPIVLGMPRFQSFEELQYGHRTKNLGDMNNDGFDDWGTLALKGCYAEIHFGEEVLDYEPDVLILLPQKGKAECFDWTAGDINGDEWSDIIISNSSDLDVIFANTMINYLNRIYIFFGGPDWPNVLNFEDADVVLEDTETFYEFGKKLAVVGDYNADGYNDLIVGGGKHKNCLREAFVYFGGEQISTNPDMVISVPCTQCGITFAEPITPCGDINADGYDDFTLGDPSNGSGKSLVYLGGPSADSLFDLAIINPDTIGGYFGRSSVRTKGDYDADGHPDIIQYGNNSNKIYVYKGGPDFDQNFDYVLSDSTVNGSIACLEYLDQFSGAGKSDVVISDYNNNYNLLIFKGGNINKQQADFVLQNDFGRTGNMVASGDFNHDSFTEIFVGNPSEPNYGCRFGGVVQLYRSQIPVEINEFLSSNNQNLSIFPNPASSQLNLEFQLDNQETVILKLIDLNGKTLWYKTIYESVTGKNIIQLKTKGIQNGLYFLQFQSGSSIINKKVIIMKEY